MKASWPLFLFVLVVEFVGLLALVVLWNWVFHNPTCDVMFQCGCTWNWAGGWDDCNVHSTDPDVLKCPYCSSPPSVSWITQWGVMGCMIVSYYMVAYWKILFSPCMKSKPNLHSKKEYQSAVNIILRVLIPISTFFMTSLVVGFSFFCFSDYDKFLFYSTT